MPDPGLPLLNIYEVETDGGPRHLVGFLDTVLAGIKGVDSRAMVGEFDPGPGGAFDPGSFRVNPEFLEALTAYMNEVVIHNESVVAQAATVPGTRLSLVDPRNRGPRAFDPPPEDILGSFAVDDAGRLVPCSFAYNDRHAMFNPDNGVCGLLEDRRFYHWLHPLPTAPQP